MKVEVELSELLKSSQTGIEDHPYQLNEKYLIRTVTMIYAGVLKKVFKNELVLNRAVWIPSTKRWMETASTGEVDECEPYPPERDVIVCRGAILDVVAVPKYQESQK